MSEAEHRRIPKPGRSLAGPSQDCLGLDPAMAAQGAEVIQRPCDATGEQFVLIGPLG
ncbi:hypothetical protein [Actinoallomurus sp. CA-150999]|uniref:hypothetical protein n=1 Tax=Actinoallomurus sp. CA-150999 TaxID=3239887 RepID=UPI003D89D984